MSEEKKRCQATTKAGKPCKNWAQPGSDTCHLHAAAAVAAPSAAPTAAEQAEFSQLVRELNELAAKLQSEEPTYTPPPFSPVNLLKLLRQNIDRFTPEAQRTLLREMQNSLQGASPKDLLDPETWKGMWYMINYSVQFQAEQLKQKFTGETDEE